MNHIADIVQNSTYTHKRFRKFFVCLLFFGKGGNYSLYNRTFTYSSFPCLFNTTSYESYAYSRITPYACVNELVTPQSANIASVTYGMEYRKYWMSKKGTSYTPIHQANDKETIQTTRVYKSSA